MKVELRSCQSTCLVLFFLIRLAYDVLCTEKLDQWLCEKLGIPAVFAASALFLFPNFSSPWLPCFASLYPLEANLSLSPVVTPLDIRTNLQGCMTDALSFWPFFSNPENSLALLFFGTGIKTFLFQSCGHCWVFQICWHVECNSLTQSSFRIWNSWNSVTSTSFVCNNVS